MKVEIISVSDRGTLNSEVVTLKVNQDCNLRFYMLVDTTYNSSTTKISNEHRHSYWFRNKQAKKGDIVKLYTRNGTNGSETKNGITTHNYYWNSSKSIWNNTGDKALLFEINTWATHTAN